MPVPTPMPLNTSRKVTAECCHEQSEVLTALIKVSYFCRFYKDNWPCESFPRASPRILEWSHISEESLKLKLHSFLQSIWYCLTIRLIGHSKSQARFRITLCLLHCLINCKLSVPLVHPPNVLQSPCQPKVSPDRSKSWMEVAEALSCWELGFGSLSVLGTDMYGPYIVYILWSLLWT